MKRLLLEPKTYSKIFETFSVRPGARRRVTRQQQRSLNSLPLLDSAGRTGPCNVICYPDEKWKMSFIQYIFLSLHERRSANNSRCVAFLPTAALRSVDNIKRLHAETAALKTRSTLVSLFKDPPTSSKTVLIGEKKKKGLNAIRRFGPLLVAKPL